jgi:putative transposase
MVVRIADWMVLLARSAASKDAELLVFGREVAVPRRPRPGPKLDWAGRAVLAALARLLPRPLRMCRLVRPGTLLLVPAAGRWRWAYPGPAAGREWIGGSRCLVGQLARDNPGWGYRPVHGELLRPGNRGRRAGSAAGAQRGADPPTPWRGRPA